MKFGLFYNPMAPKNPGQKEFDHGHERRVLTAGRLGNPDLHLWDSFEEFKAARGDLREDNGAPPMMLEMGRRFADLPGTMMCGPDRAREFTRQLETTNVDAQLLNRHFGRTKHEHKMESLEIWATQVIPEFRERDGDRQEWRAKQLESIDLPVVSSVAAA